MHDNPDIAYVVFGHTLLALAVGVALMVLVAMVVERRLARAVMRRVLWQAVLLGLGGLLAFELTGAGHAVSALLSAPGDTPHIASFPQAGSEVIATTLSERPIPTDSPRSLDETFGFSQRDARNLAWSQTPYSFSAKPAEDRPIEQRVPLPNSSALGELSLDTSEPPVLPSAEKSAESHATAPVAQPPMAVSLRGRFPALATWCLILVWTGGTCFFIGRAFFARIRLNRARRQWEFIDAPRLAQRIDDLGRQVGIKRPVRVCEAAGIPAPVAFGVLRPTVLLPTDFTRRFSSTQQQVILAHELAHLAAHDPAWLLIGELISALLWWHPLAHVACRRLLAASEQAADEASLLVPDGPDVLADCLVKLGRRLTGKPRFGWVAAEGSGLRSGLAQRVQQLLKLSDRSTSLPTRRVSAAAKPALMILLMILTISCTLWARPKVSLAQGEGSMNVLKVSWRQSLAATALAVVLGPLTTDATADDAPAPPKPAQLEQGPLVDQVLVAQRGEREHREHEAREGRERGERQRDAEHRETEARDRPERARGDQRERPEGEREELRRRAEQLEREKAEFQQNAEREARELEGANRTTQQEREENARHIAELEKELAELREEGDDDEGDDGEDDDELEEEIDELSEKLEEIRQVRVELGERAENVKREMGEHRANVERRMHELKQEFAKVHGQLERLEAASARENPERADAMRRVHEMARQIGELHRTGKHEEAQRLQQEMAQLHQRLATPRDRERPEGRDRERPEAEERLGQMERELHELREAGRHDAAEEMERELHELHRRLAVPRDGDRPGPPPELQARIEHLHVAMENLRAAGLHEQAEQIAQQIERLAREHVPGPPERGDPDAQARGPRPEGRPGPGDEIVNQLRGEIERLRGENEEIRRVMNELREGQERLMNELRERR